MDKYDDDEQRNSYERANYDRDTYIKFADIIHHYDDTADVAHDNINYDCATLDDLDGFDFDEYINYNNNIVTSTFIVYITHLDDCLNGEDDDDDDWGAANPNSHYLNPDFLRKLRRPFFGSTDPDQCP